MSDAIASYVEQHRDRFLEELKTFIRFPSVSAQPDRAAACRDCAAWLQRHLADIGLASRLEDQGGLPIVVAQRDGRTRRRVVIYGHYDVQPEDPVDAWRTPPFEPVVRDGILTARGATDDKGQLFAHVKAVEALLRTEGALPCDVVFLLEGEEESGGDALARFVRGPAADWNCDAVVISDGDMLDADTPALTYGLRGILTFEITCQGPAQDLHSGAYGGAVANPAWVLTGLLAQCVDTAGRITIPGFTDAVRPMADWERRNLARLNFDEQALLRETGAPALFGEPDRPVLERLWARPTFEINGLTSGYQGRHSKTIIPATASAKISVRLVPDQDPADIRRRIEEHLQAICPPTVRLSLQWTGAARPVLFDVTTAAMRAAQDALREAFGTEPAFIRTGGSIPVVNTFSSQWHCPVVLMGLGLDSDGPHSPNEHFRLANLWTGIAASAGLLRRLGTEPC